MKESMPKEALEQDTDSVAIGGKFTKALSAPDLDGPQMICLFIMSSGKRVWA